MPYKDKDNGRLETSVVHLDRCDEERVWHLGRTCKPDKTLYGRTDFSVQLAVQQALECLAAPQPDFDEHAVVVKWPEAKEEQKRIALALADKAGVCQPPPPEVTP